jgi:hypothetical protein
VRDTLKKHQAVIEQYFGVIRFETDKPAEGSKGGRPEVFALLTEPQTNFALTLSRNNAKKMQRKAELIADFERAKTALRSQLEAQFDKFFQHSIIALVDIAEIRQTRTVRL